MIAAIYLWCAYGQPLQVQVESLQPNLFLAFIFQAENHFVVSMGTLQGPL